jgi:predicted secreted protein
MPFITAAMAMLLVQVVTASQAQPAECQSAIEDPNQPVLASSGQTFAIVLESQPGTGYSWSMSEAPDPAIVEPVTSATLPATIPRPGAPETQCFVFIAVGAGETSIQFQYSRPFEPDAPPAQTQDVQVIAAPSGEQVPVQIGGK